MRARAERAVVVGLALAAASACDDIGPLDLHPDVLTLEVLLVAGESEARTLAVHPHRDPGDGEPEVSATLEGPVWESAFSETLELEACTRVTGLPGTAKCLRAALPEPVRAGAAYGLRGTAPLGSFTGETRVPDPPLLLSDTLRLSWPDEGEWFQVPLRYRAGADIGALLVDARDIFETREDGTEAEVPIRDLRLSAVLDPAAADTMWMAVRDKPLRFSLTLLGVGLRWTKFVLGSGGDTLFTGVEGLEGEGVYGYFDGVARSRAAHVLVR